MIFLVLSDYNVCFFVWRHFAIIASKLLYTIALGHKKSRSSSLYMSTSCYLLTYIRESVATRLCGARLSFAILAKLKMAKISTWPTAAIDNKTNWHKKWVIWLFLIRILSLLLIFRMFDLTIHQDKKCLAFFSRKNITQPYMVRLCVISAIYWPSFIS